MSRIYWYIGQPGTGKSTIAKQWFEWQQKMGFSVVHLDGDDLRVILGGLYSKEHFTKEYRIDNTRALQRMVEHMANQGVNIVVSTVNPYREVREELKKRNKNVYEIYVINNGDHVRQDRAVADFEAPIENYLLVDTTNKTPKESFEQFYGEIIEKITNEK